MRHAVRLRPRKREDVNARRRALRASLTAAGIAPTPLLSTIDLTRCSPLERYFHEQAMAAGYAEYDGAEWPCDVGTLAAAPAQVMRSGRGGAVYRFPDGTLCCVHVGGGWFNVHAAGPSQNSLQTAFAAFRDAYPASFLQPTDDPKVPVTFWTNGPFGPSSRLRRIEAQPWEAIRDNYSGQVRVEMDDVMAWHDGPGRDGQLMLWQGPPGTGKTYTLRALAQEWAKWAEFHYITDPDAFFVDQPSYMIDVLLSESYDVMEVESGDVYAEADPEGKWRILILEDTGELLSANAKEKYGQGLSRLLNVVDGMLGQGLRVMALVTTNDELDDLNPATTRPGRCASQVVFGPLTAEEAAEWSGDPAAEAGTLAELYARYRADSVENPLNVEEYEPSVEAPEPVTAAAEPDPDGDTVAQIQAVAEAHEPDGGYGETWWHPDDAAVFWNAADWTTNDEVDAAAADFLAIEGVEQFESDAETVGPGGDGWQQVWPVQDADQATARLVALAAAPLVLGTDARTAEVEPRRPEPAVTYALPELIAEHIARAMQAAAERSEQSLRAYLAQVLEASSGQSERAFQVIERALALAETGHQATADERATLRDALLELARKPHPEPSPLTVEMPAQQFDLHSHAAPITVDAPITVPQPQVEVHAPITVEAAAPAPAPAPFEPQPIVVERSMPGYGIRVEHDDDGRRVFVPVPAEELSRSTYEEA